MRVLVSVLDVAAGASSTVFLDVEAESSVAAIVPTLLNVTASEASPDRVQVAVDGVVFPSDALLGETGLHEGSWVSLLGVADRPQPGPVIPDAGVQVRVVSGIGAGRVHYLTAGFLTLGGDAGVHVRTRQQGVPGCDVVLVVDGDGSMAAVPQNGSSSAATLWGAPLSERTALAWGDQLSYDDVVVEVQPAGVERAAVDYVPERGVFAFNRPPRIVPPTVEGRFRLPPRPQEESKHSIPWLTALLPLVMGGTMALVYQRATMLLFGLFSPLLLVGNWVASRRSGRAQYQKRLGEYEHDRTEIEADTLTAVAADRRLRHDRFPDPAAVSVIAAGPTPRLWERRPRDTDYLQLRIGTQTAPSVVSLDDPEQLEHRRTRHWDVQDAPVTVSLADVGVVGVSGDESADALISWWLAQVAVLHSPRDTQVYLLAAPEPGDRGTAARWGTTRWLPSLRPALGQPVMRTVGFGATDIAARIAELISLIDQRHEAAGKQRTSPVGFGSTVVVFIADAHRLRTMPGLLRVLRDGPAVGVFCVCTETDPRLLPEECQTVVDCRRARVRVQRQAEETLSDVRQDLVDDAWTDFTCRAVAGVEDVSPSVTDSAVPDSSRLLDVLGLDSPTSEAIAARWALEPASTSAVIGESLDGPFAIDIRTDGPHGLIAGTTGSGKSELLQTIVASLAVANTPEWMTFVLVDYKGGAAFKDCVGLPHTVGMVTDLDSHLVERALASLGAELAFRERVLATAGAKDLEDYVVQRERQTSLPVLPRLLIVIDEFASLVRELPDFVDGLVNIAQRGRSLGIHLLLATQRPSGVISPAIRANTNLRIALRVTDSAESTDVINADDAAQISKSTPGRAFARLGSTSLVPFQSGRVGGRRPTRGDAAPAQPLITTIGLDDLAAPSPVRRRADDGADAESATDLTNLVTAVREAWQARGGNTPRRPWLPELPQIVTLDQIQPLSECHSRTGTARRPPAAFALSDQPDQQQQVTETVDFDDFAHLFVVGAPRSGRTTALRTIAASVSARYPADRAHIHAIDCGAGGLTALRALPNVGSVIARHETDGMVRLLARVQDTIRQRHRLLTSAGVANLTELEQLSLDEAPPRLMMLIDGWEAFTAMFADVNAGQIVEAVHTMLREAASVGVHFVIAGDRQLLVGRTATLTDRKILLNLTDRNDYGFAGLTPRKMPESIPPGRAFTAGDGTELQIAVVSADASARAQVDAIAAIAGQLAERDRSIPSDQRPHAVRLMPESLTWQQLVDEADGLAGLALGLGGQDVTVQQFSPELTPTLLVAGPARSGRTNTLRVIAAAAAAHGWRLTVITPRDNALTEHAAALGATVLTDPATITEQSLTPLIDDARHLLLVDDVELTRDMPAEAWLKQIIPTLIDHQAAIVIAGTLGDVATGFSSWRVEIRKNQQGILLDPQQLTDGDLIGTRITRAEINAEAPAGRGWANLAGTGLRAVQIPLAPASTVNAENTEQTHRTVADHAPGREAHS